MFFPWGHLHFRSSSIKVVFHWGCLPLRLSSIEVTFHWGHLPLRSSSIDALWFGMVFISSFSTFLVGESGGWLKSKIQLSSAWAELGKRQWRQFFIKGLKNLPLKIQKYYKRSRMVWKICNIVQFLETHRKFVKSFSSNFLPWLVTRHSFVLFGDNFSN